MLAASAVMLSLAMSGCGTTSTRSSRPRRSTKPATSAITVRVGHGIAGVDVAATKRLVVAKLGRPTSDRKVTSDVTGQPEERLAYAHPAVEVLLAPNVQQVSTTDAAAKTSEGVGVGSSAADVTAAYPGIKCDAGSVRVCRLSPPAAGAVVTDFLIAHEMVSTIVIGRVVE